jgi:toxin ParE1/3/4
VASLRFSRRAETDLIEIAEYTLATWGEKQVKRYMTGLEHCCEQLASNSALGRAHEQLRPGLRRMEYGKHVILYREYKRGILVSRILHQRMLPKRHAID